MAKQTEPESDRIEPGAEPISLAAADGLNKEVNIETPYADLAGHLSEAYGVIDNLVLRHASPVETGHSLLKHHVEEALRLAHKLLSPELAGDQVTDDTKDSL